MRRLHPVASQGSRGSTLVFVLLLIAGMATLSLALLTILGSSHSEGRSSREDLSALYACEAGLSAAVQDLARGGTGNLGSQQEPLAYGPNSYWVEATEIGDGRTSFIAVGRDDRSEMGVQLVVQKKGESFFRWAAFGDEMLHMDSNARTDSYDSQDGSYESQAVNGSGGSEHANEGGDIGSNADITMDSNSQVWGDAHPGPSGTLDDNSSGDVSGAVVPLPDAIDLPGIVVPMIPSLGSYTGTPAVLPPGLYHFTSLQIDSSESATFVGPATVVCDNFRLKSNAHLYVDATAGPVEFFVINDFVLDSNTLVRSTASDPRDVAFNLLSDNILDPGVDVKFEEDDLDFDSNAKLFGTIFAPSAKIEIKSNFELFGALVARRIDLDSNCRIHYDEALASKSEDGQATYQTLCWRMVPVP